MDGRSGFAPRVTESATAPATGGSVILTATLNGDGHPAVTLRGTIRSADLIYLSDVLEEAVAESGRSVHVDLSGLESWSLLAQAIVLTAARRVDSRGDRMILCNPGEGLRKESVRTDVFNRVDTRHDAG